MSLITIRHEKAMAFEASVRDHIVHMDMRGHPQCVDAGPSPTELLVMSIGGCIGMHVALFCEHCGHPSDGIRVDLSFSMAEEDGRKHVASVYAEVEVPGLPPDLVAGAEQAARSSILPNTFARSPELDVLIQSGPGQKGS